MARGRLISKSLGSSRRFHALVAAAGSLDEFAQLLFVLIVANTDDYGRMPGDAFTVRHLCFPSSHRTEAEFEAALVALDRTALVTRYYADESLYLQVNNFDQHQPNLHKRTVSRFPDMIEIPGDSGLARAGGTQNPEPRTQKRTQNPEPPPAETNEPQRSASAQPRRASEQPVTLSAKFDLFWQAYPLKVGKDAALRVFAKLAPDNDLLDRILAAIREQRASAQWLKNDGEFIPHPRTWLHQGRWQDEPRQAPMLPKSELSEPWICPHVHPCPHQAACRSASILGRPRRETKAS